MTVQFVFRLDVKLHRHDSRKIDGCFFLIFNDFTVDHSYFLVEPVDLCKNCPLVMLRLLVVIHLPTIEITVHTIVFAHEVGTLLLKF